MLPSSLRMSADGFTIVERARQRRGWTKTSTARWWQEANTSRATLRRFWHGDRIQTDIFISLCAAVGITEWQQVAASEDWPADRPTADTPANPPGSPLHLDLDEASDTASFYGRMAELKQLHQWLIGTPNLLTTPRYKLVVITGLPGIGKTALALAWVDQYIAQATSPSANAPEQRFQRVIWRSLHPVPTATALIDHILTAFDPDHGTITNLDQGIRSLIAHLRQQSTLLILDGLDQSAVLSQTATDPAMGNPAADYTLLLERLSRDRHPSCVLITSRERWGAIAVDPATVQWLPLKGLLPADSLSLCNQAGLSGRVSHLHQLCHSYSGNPLALKSAAHLIRTLFNGNVEPFLAHNAPVLGDRLQAILVQHWQHLSPLEQDIAYWLAIWQEPITLARLHSHWFCPPLPSDLLAGLLQLEQRSLLEQSFPTDAPLVTLSPLVMQIVTTQLVNQAQQEFIAAIRQSSIQPLQVVRTHWLLRPGTDKITGDRILNHLHQALYQHYNRALAVQLVALLGIIQAHTPREIGYAGANLVALLKLEGELA